MKIPIEQIKPSPEPVRSQMNPAKLDELAQSIKEQGLIVPIKVRALAKIIETKDDKPVWEKEIVYGHRRFAAARIAGLKEIECILEGVDVPLIQALIENIVREDMNDADKRDGLCKLKELTGKTWTEVGAMFGRTEGWARTIASITDDEAKIVAGYDVTAEHITKARQAGDDSLKVLEKAAKEGLSKRQVESIAKSVAVTEDPKRKKHLIDTPYDPYTHDPEWNKERADKFGASDPTSFSRKKSRSEEWKDMPETKAVFEYLKDTREYADRVEEMFTSGKFAPEAKLFVIGKIRPVIEKWQQVIKELEK